jgi:hypothetical protein
MDHVLIIQPLALTRNQIAALMSLGEPWIRIPIPFVQPLACLRLLAAASWMHFRRPTRTHVSTSRFCVELRL